MHGPPRCKLDALLIPGRRSVSVCDELKRSGIMSTMGKTTTRQ